MSSPTAVMKASSISTTATANPTTTSPPQPRASSPTPSFASNPSELRSDTENWPLRGYIAEQHIILNGGLNNMTEKEKAAFGRWQFDAPCAHRPRDLVYLSYRAHTPTRYITHGQLWAVGRRLQVLEAAGQEMSEVQRRVLDLVREHGDCGWRVVRERQEGGLCEVCGRTEGQVWEQEKTEGMEVFARVVCFRCMGLTDEETGSVRRWVRLRTPQAVKQTFSYEPGDVMPDELGPEPVLAMARPSLAEHKASVAATKERLRRAHEAGFMRFPRELTKAEAANMDAGWAISGETPTIWVRI